MEHSKAEDKAGDSAQVLQWIMDQGHLDDLRKKVLEQLKQNEGLRGDLDSMLQGSDTLSKADASDLTGARKKRTFEKLRKELDKKLVEKAATIAWQLINDPQGEMYKLIEAKAHEGLCAVYQQQHDQPNKGILLPLAPREEEHAAHSFEDFTSPQMRAPTSLHQPIGSSNPTSSTAGLQTSHPPAPSSTAAPTPQPSIPHTGPPTAPPSVRPPAPPPGAPPPPAPPPHPPPGGLISPANAAVAAAAAAGYGSTAQAWAQPTAQPTSYSGAAPVYQAPVQGGPAGAGLPPMAYTGQQAYHAASNAALPQMYAPPPGAYPAAQGMPAAYAGYAYAGYQQYQAYNPYQAPTNQ